MILITNRNKFPVQLIVRSRTAPIAFTTLNIPGLGAGNNTYELEDERSTVYIERAEKMGLISTKYVSNRIKQ